MSNKKLKYSGKLMYVAEDDYYSFLLIKEFLNDTGFTIEHAHNGDILIEMIRKTKPDIILLDINMPQMNGLKAIKEIRQNGWDIPVLAETAYAMADERQIILDAGCDEYIAKPIYKVLLHELVDKLMA